MVNGKRVLAVRFWVIKQDQRVERPEARTEEGDWVYISDLPGTVFSVFTWFARFQRHVGNRPDREAPFFLDPSDTSRPWLYRQALRAFQTALTGLGLPSAGLHGLRVAGYNGTRSVLGVEVAVAQGGWQSGAHTRYWRCSMSSILDIPAAITGALGSGDAGELPGSSSERVTGAPVQRMVRQDLARALDEDLEDFVTDAVDDEAVEPAAAHAALLPPGWHEERRTTRSSGEALARPYAVYLGPEGARAESRPAAWRVHDAASQDQREFAVVSHEDRRDNDMVSTQDQRGSAVVTTSADGVSPSRERGERSAVSASPNRRRRARAARLPAESLDSGDDLSQLVPFWDRPPSARPARGARSS